MTLKACLLWMFLLPTIAVLFFVSCQEGEDRLIFNTGSDDEEDDDDDEDDDDNEDDDDGNDDDDEETPDGDGVPCLRHSDCPTLASCQVDILTGQGFCVGDACAATCTRDEDCAGCMSGLLYLCLFASDGQLKCQPQIAASDGDVDGDACVSNADCPPGSECDNASHLCLPVGNDDDDDDDDDDNDDNSTDGDTTDGDQACSSDAQCGAGQICGPYGFCIADCREFGCTYGTCNTNNGRCEFCEPICATGQCCNYGGTFYYCGSCCPTPCAEGTVCQSGNCVTPTCPTNCRTSDPCYSCGPETGYLCERTDAPGCNGSEYRTVECLRTGQSCREGVDVCCLGHCLLGTCL